MNILVLSGFYNHYRAICKPLLTAINDNIQLTGYYISEPNPRDSITKWFREESNKYHKAS